VAIRGIPDEFEPCLRYRTHSAKEPYYPGAGEYSGPDWGQTFAALCTACGTVIYTTVDVNGNVTTAPRYIRTPEYEAALATVRKYGLTAADFRANHLAEYKRQARARTKQKVDRQRRKAS